MTRIESQTKNREIEDGGVGFEIKNRISRKKNTDRLEFFYR